MGVLACLRFLKLFRVCRDLLETCLVNEGKDLPAV